MHKQKFAETDDELLRTSAKRDCGEKARRMESANLVELEFTRKHLLRYSRERARPNFAIFGNVFANSATSAPAQRASVRRAPRCSVAGVAEARRWDGGNIGNLHGKLKETLIRQTTYYTTWCPAS